MIKAGACIYHIYHIYICIYHIYHIYISYISYISYIYICVCVYHCMPLDLVGFMVTMWGILRITTFQLLKKCILDVVEFQFLWLINHIV